MHPGVSNPSQGENITSGASDGTGNAEPTSSNNQPPDEQNLQGDTRHEPRRTRSRRRGRRRGRRRRRGQQRARARARAREEAQIATADTSEDAGSTSEDSDYLLRDDSGSARSRSPRRQRSFHNAILLRQSNAEMRSAVNPPRLLLSPCRVPSCDWSGPLEDAAQHARITHNDAILRGPRQRLSVPLAFAAYTRYWRLIDAFDELFLVQFRRRADSRRRLQAAVQLVGPASRAARFLYLLHMKVMESQDQADPVTSTQPTTSCITPPVPYITRISLVLGQTSSTRVDLEPAMISLWSAHNFSQPGTSLENVSLCLPVMHPQDVCESASAPRVLDLTLFIQRVLGQKE